MASLQKEEDNEDITHSDTHASPPTTVKGPITIQPPYKDQLQEPERDNILNL
jgi:hypothetical protein